MATPETPPVVTTPAPSPVIPDGQGGDTPKVFTEEQVLAKLRGKHGEVERTQKALDAANAKLAAADAAAKKRDEDALAAQGEHKELAAKRETERDAAITELAALKAERKKRLDLVEAANKKRIKAIPEEFHALIPPGLDADTLAGHLATVEAHAAAAAGQTQQPGVFAGGPKPRGNLAPGNTIEDCNKRLEEIQANPFAQRAPSK